MTLLAARRFGDTNDQDDGDEALPGRGVVPFIPPGMPAAQPQTIIWRGFRVPSKDHHGHSERVWTSIQPGHARMLATIQGTKYYPYRVVGDIIRHAIDRHIRWLEGIQAVPSVTAQVDAIMELLREDEFATDFRTLFDKLQTQVQIYVGLGANPEAMTLVKKVEEFVDGMPDEDPWKERYVNELKARFGHLLQNARGVSMADFVTAREQPRERRPGFDAINDLATEEEE